MHDLAESAFANGRFCTVHRCYDGSRRRTRSFPSINTESLSDGRVRLFKEGSSLGSFHAPNLWQVLDHKGRPLALLKRRDGDEERTGRAEKAREIRREWCPRRGSNPYTLRLRILSPLRLPISSLGRALESGLYRTVPAFGLFDELHLQKAAVAGLWIARTS